MAKNSRLNPVQMPEGIHRDDRVRGLFLRVGKRIRTWYVQYDTTALGKRNTHRVRLGTFPELTLAAARRAAQEQLGARRRKTTGRVTLRDAHQAYRERLVRLGRSAKTIQQADDCINRLLAGWLDTPLGDLAAEPGKVAEAHIALTDINGPYAANRAMQTLRAIYRHTRKSHNYLPAEHPVVAVDFNPEERRNSGMSLQDLPGWFQELDQLDNPIRRAFHLFTLMSGCRPGALKVAQWSDLNVPRRSLTIPNPKGGRARAYDIPLSRGMLRVLNAAKRGGAFLHAESAQTYVFAGSAGHIIEYKEKRLSRVGNDLRQSYATIATEVGVPKLLLKVLMNHAVDSDITEGYVTVGRLWRELLDAQEKITKAILTAAE
ncbi:MAG: integrase arm-type DNA-binding domain-containing protein [Woeseia sp.]